jgi:hypothetical protein
MNETSSRYVPQRTSGRAHTASANSFMALQYAPPFHLDRIETGSLSELWRAEPTMPAAFDGSKNNAFWQASRDFAKSVKKADGSAALKFTYFVNPSYYVPEANKSGYCGPRVGCGKSAIGFGGTTPTFRSASSRPQQQLQKGTRLSRTRLDTLTAPVGPQPSGPVSSIESLGISRLPRHDSGPIFPTGGDQRSMGNAEKSTSDCRRSICQRCIIGRSCVRFVR